MAQKKQKIEQSVFYFFEVSVIFIIKLINVMKSSKETKMLECPYHGLTEFVIDNEGRFKCRKCRVDSVTQKRKNIKKKLVEYKGGKCEKCGYDKYVEALDFHHLDPTNKTFNINAGNLHFSMEKLKNEADKCILLCCRCHRELHAEENRQKEIEYEEFKLKNKENFKNPSYRKIDSLPLDEIKKDLDNGLTQKDVSMKYKISKSTLQRFLEKYKLTRKTKRLNRDEIIDAFNKEPTVEGASRMLDVTVKVLCKKINDFFLQDEINNIREQNGLKKLIFVMV